MEDILLRALEPQDIDIIYTWENDVTVWESSDTHTPFSRYMLEQYIISAQSVDIQVSKQLRMMIDMGIDGVTIPIGCVDIFDYNILHRRAGIGILVDKKYRGKGIATAAINKICNYCKHHLYLHSVYANVRQDNVSSIRAFEKNEFLLIGTKKDWVYDGEGFHDEYMFQKILK